MSEITLTAEIRKELGKRSHALRASGKIPGIYYGHGQQNIPLSLPELQLKPLYATSATHVINLKLNDGSSHSCILREVQFDPVTERPVHFDLFGLAAHEQVVIEVPVKLTGGTPKGVKDGGILQHVMHRLRVSCLPKDIPDHVEINVETLEINRSIHVKDVTVPNVTVMDNENSTVVAVVPPTVLKEGEGTPAAATTETAEAPAEPEVIAKGKKAEEGAEAAPAEKPEKAEKPAKPEKPEKAAKAEKK